MPANEHICTYICCSQLQSLKFLFISFLFFPPSFFFSCTLLHPNRCWRHGIYFSTPFSMPKQWCTIYWHTQGADLFGHLVVSNEILLHILSDLVFSIDEKPSISIHNFFPRCEHPWGQEIWELSLAVSYVASWRLWIEAIIASDFYFPRLWNGSLLLPHLLYRIPLSKFSREYIWIYTKQTFTG